MIGSFILFSALSLIFPPRDAGVHHDYDWSDEVGFSIDGKELNDEVLPETLDKAPCKPMPELTEKSLDV